MGVINTFEGPCWSLRWGPLEVIFKPIIHYLLLDVLVSGGTEGRNEEELKRRGGEGGESVFSHRKALTSWFEEKTFYVTKHCYIAVCHSR